MPGERADDGILSIRGVIEVTAAAELDQAGHGGGGGGLTEHALRPRQERVSLEDLAVGHLLDQPAGLFACRDRVFPARWITDPDRRGDRIELVVGEDPILD